jgi:hypothetical protein
MVFFGLASKPVATVSSGFTSKPVVGFLVEPQNQGDGGPLSGTATGSTRSLELLVEEFQSIFSFGAAGLSSRGKISRLSTLMVGTQQLQETNDMQRVITRKIRHKSISRNAPVFDSRFISSHFLKL